MVSKIVERALEGLHAAPEAHTMADWLCVGMFPFLIVLGSLAG